MWESQNLSPPLPGPGITNAGSAVCNSTKSLDIPCQIMEIKLKTFNYGLLVV